MKILISGGAGFIGTRLQQQLTDLNFGITIMDNLSRQIHGELPLLRIHDGINFIRGDVRSVSDWKSALQDIDTVIHLAAETGTGQSMYEMSKYIDTNCIGTACLFQAINELPQKKVTRVILSSSRAIYGEGSYVCTGCGLNNINPAPRTKEHMEKQQWEHFCENCGSTLVPIATNESTIPSPASIYAVTKLDQEHIVKINCNTLGIDYSILRFQNVYGAGQSLKNPYTGLLTVFTNQLKNKKNIHIYEDGLESRDFVHVNDVCDAICTSVIDKHAINDAFNVGSGVATSITTIAGLLASKYAHSTDFIFDNKYRVGDIRHCWADLSKIDKRFGFTPNVSLENGISEFYNWTLEQPLEEDLYEKAEMELKVHGIMN